MHQDRTTKEQHRFEIIKKGGQRSKETSADADIMSRDRNVLMKGRKHERK